MFGTDEISKEEYIDVMPVGIGENKTSALRIYPNPNNGEFFLSNNYKDEFVIRIYSVYGQLVDEIILAPGENRIALAETAKGVYVVSYESKDGMVRNAEKMMIR
jgi:hypothetical protein